MKDENTNNIPHISQEEIKQEVQEEVQMEDLAHIDDAKLKDIIENKDVAAASYFLLLSPVLLFTRKDSGFIQYHARQAFTLFLIFVFLWFLGTFFVLFAWLTIGVLFIALTGFIQAINGKYYEIPYIYDFGKDGYSIELFVNMVKNIFRSGKEIIVGLFPKNSFTKNENISVAEELQTKENIADMNKNLLKTVDDLKGSIVRLEQKIAEMEKVK